MDLRLTGEQERLREETRELLGRLAPLRKAPAVASSPRGYSQELWGELAGRGLLGISLPSQYGGQGRGFIEACLVLEELGRARTPSPYLSSIVLGAGAILEWGSERQRKEYLPEIAAGRLLVSYADFEPTGSWGGWPRSLRARSRSEGIVLDGEASYVPYAAEAGVLLVAAQWADDSGAEETDGGEGLLLLVDPRAAGVKIEPLETVDWDRYSRVRFDGVRLDAAAVLGEGNEAADARRISEWGAAARCAEMVGGAAQVLELSTEYASRRRQFGRAIGSFQAIQHRAADMALDAVSSRLLAYEAIWRLSEGLDAAREVSVAKAWVGEAYMRICAAGHQIHGAIGYTRGHVMHLFYRHAQAASLQFGDAGYHRGLLAEALEL